MKVIYKYVDLLYDLEEDLDLGLFIQTLQEIQRKYKEYQTTINLEYGHEGYIEFEVRVYREETEEESKIRLEREKERTDRLKEEEEKRELRLLRHLANKYNKTIND